MLPFLPLGEKQFMVLPSRLELERLLRRLILSQLCLPIPPRERLVWV